MAKERKNTPVRIDDESIRLAKIAASYRGLTLADYVSEALLEIAKRDIERGHSELTTATPPKKARGSKE